MAPVAQAAHTPQNNGDAGTGKGLSSASLFGLVALVVVGWSTSWIALHYQLGVVAPEISLLWRFALAGSVMAVICMIRAEKLRGFTRRDHADLLVMGLTLFSFNFFCFYVAGQHLVSGLLSVIFALAAPGNLLLQALVLRQSVSVKTVAGSVLGLVGLVLLFAPEVGLNGVKNAPLSAVLMGCFGVVVFCTGNYFSVRVQRRGIPLLPAITWGMIYGAIACALLGVLLGHRFEVEWTVPYLGGLVWLALVSSVLAFLGYMSLLRGIGAAKTGYLTVLFPVFALLISTFFEYYAWTIWAVAGLVLVGIGNLLVLRTGEKKALSPTVTEEHSGIRERE